MKNILKWLGAVCLFICIILIPLIINILFKFDFNIWWLESEWSAGEALNFYGGLLSFIGAIILGSISIWQTNRANNISKKLLDKDLLESIDFIQLENKFEATIKHNKDSKIVQSTHHKSDYGANILIEEYKDKPATLNVYLIKLYFSNSSKKNHIKKIELENFMCVQDPDDNGLFWDDGSDDPIPLGLHVDIIKDVYLNWISSDEFYTQFKIYCKPDMCFDSMMENNVNLCFIFQLNITSFSNVKTEMIYKIWISKDKDKEYKVINTNSTIKDNKVIDSKE